MNKDQIIYGMCVTMRHDFGLDKEPDDLLSSGMTADERASLRRNMEQLYNHHVSPAVSAAVRDERKECAELCLRMARGQGDIDRNSSAYQMYLLIMAREPEVSEILKTGKSVEEAVFELASRRR